VDLPKRLSKYDGDHVTLKRIALTRPQVRGLPSYDLRDCVESEIKKLIEPVAWKRCETVNRAERESLKTVLAKWREARGGTAQHEGDDDDR
jgi:hypothetical protein